MTEYDQPEGFPWAPNDPRIQPIFKSEETPVLPSTTKETPLVEIIERILDEESAWIARPSPEVTRRVALAAAIANAIRAERVALSSAERRIEELGRERDEAIRERTDAEVASNKWFITHLSHRTALDALGTANGELFKRAYEAESLVTALKAEVEELKRERDNAQYELARFKDAIAKRPDYETHWAEAAERAEAAESRLASLTGLVEDMRERAVKVRRWFTDYIAANLDEDAADGVTVGMVFQGNARDALWHLDKLIRSLALPSSGEES